MTSAPDVEVELLRPASASLAFGHVCPVHITVRDLTVQTKSSIVLLDSISMHISAGSLMAIMGGSGSGKTTLLNAIAGRINDISVSGEITFNNAPANGFKRILSYVEQQDRLLPYLTVRDTLRYAAQLRLARSLSKKEKFALAEEVIQELGLKECADTIIGDEVSKGISGGEKRRVSVGVQLLTNPSIVVLDEPTTGLDAFSAHSLIETLVALSNRGRTIILSIHQPRSDIFNLFVSLTLLSKGRLAYSGSQSSVLAHFFELGYPIGDHVNGADFLIDITSVDNQNDESGAVTNARVDGIIRAWKARKLSTLPVQTQNQQLQSSLYIDEGPNFVGQSRVLALRFLKNMQQDRVTLYGSIAEVLCLSLALGSLYFQLPETPVKSDFALHLSTVLNLSKSGIVSRKSSLYSICALQNYLSLMFMIYKLTNELCIFDVERADKMYSIPAYLLSWFLVNSGLYAALSIVFSVTVYFMIGMRNDNLSWHFLVFCFCVVALQFVTISYAYFCVAISRDFAISSLVGNVFFTFIVLSSGFFIAIDIIPIYLRWFQHIGYVTYGLRILSTNEFQDRVFSCPPGSEGMYICVGNHIIRQLGFTPGIADPFFGLLCIFCAFILMTFLVLHYFPKNGIKQAKLFAFSTFTNTGPKSINISEKAVHPVLLEVQNSSISLKSKRNSKADPKIILDSVSAIFPPRKLTAILGPSGSGKTTLLHLLRGRRLTYAPFVKLEESGHILHHGKHLARSDIACITACVHQEDSHLLPALTARETLRYASRLKIPHMSKKACFSRVEEVLSELRLTDCANTAIGGSKVKGLSGGEKRRVSVALAMLTDPAILLLDEPTSGLDAAIAKNVMMTLKAVASSGTTVICTVHQPRSDIVHLFDNVLLLSRGGRMVFQGSIQDMLDHFSKLDFRIPNFTNPADFAIDLVSIDLRNRASEISSKNRVALLVEAWKLNRGDNTESTEFQPISAAVTSHSIHSSSLFQALPLLISRSFCNLSRQLEIVFSRIMQILALAIILAAYFSPLSLSQDSITSRIGILQQCGSLVFIGMLNCIAVFPQELKLFKFEYQDRSYSVLTFFLTYLINELPFEIIGSILWANILIYAVGLQIKFFVCMFVAFALVNAGESFGIAFCSFFAEPGFSVQIMSAILSIMSIMAGYLSLDTPQFFDGLNYASIIRYTARLQGIQEFSGLQFECPNPSLCQFETGEQVLSLLKFSSIGDGTQEAWIGIVLCLVICKNCGIGILDYFG